MNFRAIVLWQLGQKAEALSLFDQALAKARDTGERFIGPYILVSMARRTDDPAVRRHAMQEAERILAKGTVAHNVFWFHREAMQSALEQGEWNEARRRAAALEEFTRPEPLPWSDFFVAYGRALAHWGEGQHDGETAAELKRLREIAGTVGFLSSAAAIDQTLSSPRTPE